MVVHIVEAGEGAAIGKKFCKTELWFMAGWGVAGRIAFNRLTDKQVTYVNEGPGSVQIVSVDYVEPEKMPVPIILRNLPLPVRLEPGARLTVNIG